MGVIRWLVIFAVSLFLVLFGVQNMETVTLKFSLMEVFAYEITMPLFLIVVMSVFGGAGIAGLLALGDHLRMQSKVRKQRKSIERLEGEVKQLRNMPLEDEAEEHESSRSPV